MDVAARCEGGHVSSTAQIAPPRASLATLPIDQRRGIYAMWAVIATEAMLFICMFGAYYYLGNNKDRWSQESAPELRFPLILLVILLGSSFVLHWGERQVNGERFTLARAALWITVFLGLVFLALQGFEYYYHWSELAPYSDAYGSIFYTITSLHAAHVIVGLMMLAYIGIQPRYGATIRTPHKPYSTIALYWHFVDVVWVFIVIMLYVIPNIQRMHHVH
jgi:heme/copper-type cytochrome/quinol oxidase subunit 3